MNRIPAIVTALLLLSFLLSANAQNQTSIVHEKVLKNGLKVLVKEDRRAPVMVSQIWYKVGASYEYDGITGVSHVLEHMMFQGTDNLAPGEFSDIIAKNGGRENAFTGADFTAYFQTMEASRLEVSFRLEAERMQRLKLLDEEFQKERQVVMEERRLRTEDKPHSQAYEYFKALAYTSSAYRNPIIGWMQDLKDMTLEDLSSWYQQWYAPNNATIVVAGDVKYQDVFRLAEQYFGPIPSSTITALKKRPEVAQVGERRAIVKQEAKAPYLLMGYKVPTLNTTEKRQDVYALDVLANILSGGSSARLPSTLIRGEQVAASVSASYDFTARLKTLFMFSGTPSDGLSLGVLEQAIQQQIDQLQTIPVSDAELERVKAQVIASSVYEQDSNFYQAMKLGMFETNGIGWQAADQYVDAVKNVTAEDVQRVAKTYFINDQLTVVQMLPVDKEEQ